MSVVELPSDFERTPPQDVAAEQCVLGGMLLSKDAITDVVEVLRPGDFYRPAHQTVYDVVIDLYARGEPADPVTVSAELTRRGELSRVGGAPYLHTLISSVPTAANAGYYARIVRERAILRRLVEAGTRIVQLGYTGDGDVDDIVDSAQGEVYAVTERRAGEDYQRLDEIMPVTLDEIEAISSRGGTLVGVPTGFADLDSLMNGLHPGQMVIVAARPALGKALADDTPLPTPEGWTTMGQVGVGDTLLGADGRPTRVVAATGVMSGRPCYEIEFSDGTTVVADARHGWFTETRASRKSARAAAVGYNRYRNQRTFGSVKTTAEVAETLRCPTTDRRLNHCVPLAEPLDLPEADLPLPPYVLGAWLGDGHSADARITTADPEILVKVEATGLVVSRTSGSLAYRLVLPEDGPHGSVQATLRSLAVLGDKHIPATYLRSSAAQRRALLAGLLDTDGTVMPTGNVRFSVTNRRLAQDVRELVVGLGYGCSIFTKPVKGRSEGSSLAYTLTFTTSDEVFALERKRIAHKERAVKPTPRTRSRFITSVRRVPSVPVRCVEIDHPDHLYLATRSMIPTHNSTLGLDFARSAAVKQGLATVVFSLEMSRSEITMRLLSAEARVPLHHMRSGTMTDDDWQRLARRMSEVAEAPLFIDDSPNMSMMEIRAKCRRLKQRHDLRLVIVDYMQLMTSPRRVESRQQEVSELSRSLKLLAKELDVPVIAISQLNRSPEQRTDKKPQLSDLRESGCLTADTRVWRADTGAEVSLGELLEAGAHDMDVWSVDESLRLRPARMTHVFPSGVKEVFKLRLRSGAVVKASANHPFLTLDGWRRLDTLTPGTRIASPRRVPEPAQHTAWSDEEVVLLAHLTGDGSFLRRKAIRYASVDEDNLRAVSQAARHFGVTAARDDYPVARCTTLRLVAPYRLTHGRRNPVGVWLDQLGLLGCRSHEKFVPSEVFGLPRRQVALFVRHLWSTDGCVRWDETAGQCRLYYASTSRRLVDDVSRLLLRLGIQSRIKRVGKEGYRDSFHLLVYGATNQLAFLEEVGANGARGEAARQAVPRLRSLVVNTNLDTVPREVWGRVKEALAERQITHRQFAIAMGTKFCGSTMWKHAPSRARLSRVATVLEDAGLEMLATSDVFWDEVASIQSLGRQPVYDATVLGTHNFVADGILAHNSIEQDSDIVILLYREDAFERESPRAGEADLIVAKHRNGPTATVTVAFQGHYSRFVDMAPG
ncbi:MAG: replicative DNA helicase [Streptosporangiaceae bacterium]